MSATTSTRPREAVIALWEKAGRFAGREVSPGLTLRAAAARRARRALVGLALALLALTLWWGGLGNWVLDSAGELVREVQGASAQGQRVALLAGGGVLMIFASVFALALRRPRAGVVGHAVEASAVGVNATEASPQVARHEAGHAVVAYALGAEVLSITTLTAGSLGGQCVWWTDPARPAAENAWVSMCAWTAGQVSVPQGREAWPGAGVDVEQSLRAATFLVTAGQRPTGYDGPLSIEALLRAASTRAAGVLSANRQVHDDLAGVLQSERAVTGEQVRPLLDRITR